jgi:hypothetical protein
MATSHLPSPNPEPEPVVDRKPPQSAHAPANSNGLGASPHAAAKEPSSNSANEESESASVPKSIDPDALGRLHKVFGKWLHIPPEDQDIIDVFLATYVSNRFKGDPLWLMLIDGSGGGKTELARSVKERRESYFMGRISPKALNSGYRGKDAKGKDPSILPQLNGKVFVIKDLSPLLSMKAEDRREVIGTLRDVYDGFTIEAKGNVGKVEHTVRFTCITATTLAIENFTGVEQELGERFIKIRAHCSSDADLSKVERALGNTFATENMREEIQLAVSQFLDSFPEKMPFTQPDPKVISQIARVADFTARARSHVSRDGKHELQYFPRPEVGTRLAQELLKLCTGLAVVRGRTEINEDDLKTLRRVANDCLPINRKLVLDILRKRSNLRASEMAEESGLPYSTIKLILDDLYVLKIASRTEECELGDGKKIYAWSLASD